MLSMSNQTHRNIMKVILAVMVLFMLTMMTKCTGFLIENQKKLDAKNEIRQANGGAIPGKELKGSDGGLYTIVTFDERPDLTCLKKTNHMGCWVE